jgi:hypothetical protein
MTQNNEQGPNDLIEVKVGYIDALLTAIERLQARVEDLEGKS